MEKSLEKGGEENVLREKLQEQMEKYEELRSAAWVELQEQNGESYRNSRTLGMTVLFKNGITHYVQREDFEDLFRIFPEIRIVAVTVGGWPYSYTAKEDGTVEFSSAFEQENEAEEKELEAEYEKRMGELESFYLKTFEGRKK